MVQVNWCITPQRIRRVDSAVHDHTHVCCVARQVIIIYETKRVIISYVVYLWAHVSGLHNSEYTFHHGWLFPSEVKLSSLCRDVPLCDPSKKDGGQKLACIGFKVWLRLSMCVRLILCVFTHVSFPWINREISKTSCVINFVPWSASLISNPLADSNESLRDQQERIFCQAQQETLCWFCLKTSLSRMQSCFRIRSPWCVLVLFF